MRQSSKFLILALAALALLLGGVGAAEAAEIGANPYGVDLKMTSAWKGGCSVEAVQANPVVACGWDRSNPAQNVILFVYEDGPSYALSQIAARFRELRLQVLARDGSFIKFKGSVRLDRPATAVVQEIGGREAQVQIFSYHQEFVGSDGQSHIFSVVQKFLSATTRTGHRVTVLIETQTTGADAKHAEGARAEAERAAAAILPTS